MSNTAVPRPMPQSLRRVVPLIVIVVGFVMISAILIQQVAAQSTGSLKPPFRLIRPANLPAPLSGVPPLPLNAPIVMSETFDSGFAQRSNNNVNDTSAPWHLVNANGIIDKNYTWGRVSEAPYTDTLWNAATYFNAPQIHAGDPYTKNMQAYAIYGPINMTDYASAFISITYALDTLDNDLFGVAFSTNGTDFTMPVGRFGRDPSLSIKHTDYYLFPEDVKRHNQVWIALVFTSEDRDNIDALGVYVEDVVLRALPAYKIFMPIMRRDPTPTPTFTPTPTATPSVTTRYFYTFGSGGSSDTEFLAWGGKNSTATTCSGSPCAYFQDIVTIGNPGGAVTLYSYDLNLKGGSGPRQSSTSLSTAKNFEYSADFYVYTGQKNARYGLVFDASDSAFPGSGDPPFAPAYNYYLLEMRMDSSTRTKVATWQILKVVNGDRNAVISAADIPASITEDHWHNLKIVQQGTTLSFYLNGSLVGTAAFDSSWSDARRRFGTFIDIRDNNNDDSNPFEVFFDNVKVVDLP